MSLETNLKLAAEKFYWECFTDPQFDNKQFITKVNEWLARFDAYEKCILLNEVIRLGRALIQSDGHFKKEVGYCYFATHPSDN